MKVAYRMSSYELPLFRAFGFFCLKAWFPIRRLARAIKRDVVFLAGWITTLLVFIPICIIVFAVLIFSGHLDFDGAIVELVSIILGSFLLLAIKELRDYEAKRRDILRKQWELYVIWRSELTYNLKTFFHHAGVEIKSFVFLESTESWKSAFRESNACDNCPNKLPNDMMQVMTSVNSIINAAREVGFIDWSVEIASNQAHNMQTTLNNITQNSQSDSVQNQIKCLGNYAVALLGQVRRPWRYGNDMAHRTFVEKYLNQYGVPIEM